MEPHDKIIDDNARRIMLNWYLPSFKRNFSRLYKVIIASMDDHATHTANLMCPKCNVPLNFSNGYSYNPENCDNPGYYCRTCNFKVYINTEEPQVLKNLPVVKKPSMAVNFDIVQVTPMSGPPWIFAGCDLSIWKRFNNLFRRNK